ncbi:hypothetical protein [Streptomyces chilikensis]|uniref:Uncharacterized protein n=1 Tax=Streptomyces chilikensis TaxID=1194079 RepID=A0ABV3ERJ1_9ACTN
MSTKARNRRNRKTTQPKPQPAPAQPDTREPLPKRPTLIGNCTLTQQAEARAAGDTTRLGLYIPTADWTATGHGTSTAPLDDGAHLHHTPVDGRIGDFTAAIPCPSGIHHLYAITNRDDLALAYLAASACGIHHGGDTAHQAVQEGVRDVPAPLEPVKVRPLPNLAQTADNDTPKEHPQP